MNAQRVAVIGGGIAGTAAAWSLHRAGFEVQLFEKGPALGGNAKTFRWRWEEDSAESPLLVIAWPGKYYHNYQALLTELGVEWQPLPIAYFAKTPLGTFAQDGAGDLSRRFAKEFRRWARLVAFVTWVNGFFSPKHDHDSLYDFSYVNPMNIVPLYWLARLFGISRAFWEHIFVTVHCASFITTKMRGVPAVIAPLLEGIAPLQTPCEMQTWCGPPRQVFERMTAGFSERVHVGHDIAHVARENGEFQIRDAQGRHYSADKVVFACGAPSALRALQRPSVWQRLLLGNARYVDDDDPTFSKFVVHSDESVLPAEHRERILSDFNTYSEIDETGSLECSFVLSSKYPGLRQHGRPMLVTFNSKKPIDKVQQRIDLPHPTHSLSLRNLLIMTLTRFLQGKQGTYYCGTFTTPEGAHDLSFLSGLVVAHEIGAPYPLPHGAAALYDFRQMQKMMLGSAATRRVVGDAAAADGLVGERAKRGADDGTQQVDPKAPQITGDERRA